MAKTIGIGIQDFEKIITRNAFYIDKTSFIKEWWESGDDVTLITRPRRFGKTLTMSMVEHFFSNRYTNQKQLFEHLSIGENEEYKKLQGNYPVISLSFSNVKENTFTSAYKRICQIITNLYSEYPFLKESNVLTEKAREFLNKISYYMEEIDAAFAIHQLSNFLYQYYNKKVIILLDEYDTPMQEAYVNGYFAEMTGFRYILTSNRESGFGRYDVMLEPLHKEDDGIILEFKVHEQEEEHTLHDTVKAALQQIEDKKYEQLLVNKNIPKNRIRKYGFAFQGKTVLIG